MVNGKKQAVIANGVKFKASQKAGIDQNEIFSGSPTYLHTVDCTNAQSEVGTSRCENNFPTWRTK